MNNWLPSRKWWAQVVGGLTPIVLSAIDSGWDRTESKMVVTLASAAVLSYLVPNKKED